MQVEFQDVTGSGGVAYQLDPADPRTLAGDSTTGLPLGGAGASSQLQPLSVGPAWLQAAVQEHDQEVMIGAGLRSFGGGATLGRAHPYRILRFSPGVALAMCMWRCARCLPVLVAHRFCIQTAEPASLLAHSLPLSTLGAKDT